MFVNGTTALGNEGSGGENETQIRKEYKAATGEKVVMKGKETGAQGSTDSSAQTVRCTAYFLLIPNKGWRGMSCMGEPWLLERLHCVHCESSRRRLQYMVRAESVRTVCIVQVTGISGLLSGMSTC